MRYLPANDGSKLAIISAAAGMLLCQSLLGAEPEEKPYNPAKNLARRNCGAQIDRFGPGSHNASTNALLFDDYTLSCPLPQGDTTFVVALPKIALLDRFAFINENAAARGEFQVAVSNYRLSPNDSKWIPVKGSTPLTGNQHFNLPILGVEAKYVKLSFHIEKEGRLAGLGLYGEPTLQSFAERFHPPLQKASTLASSRPGTRPEDTLHLNFANLYASARVVYVSSGWLPLARRMIDDDPVTAFSFSGSDPNPTAIIELARAQQLHRVSAVYQMEGGRLDVYLLNDLSGDGADIVNAKPVASVVNPVGGKAAVDFDPKGARYVALRWTRNKSHGGPFEVAEIGAFSAPPPSVLELGQAPSFTMANTRTSGQGGPDFSNNLGTLADPPTVGPVSP
jgi:hypothetical protein